MVVQLDKTHKYKLVKGTRGRGFRGVRGGLFTKICHNSVIFQFRSKKFCMVVHLDKTDKYKLVRGARGGEVRHVRGGH